MLRFLLQPAGWSTAAPLACAVHCVATPALLLFAPALATSPELEWGLLGATVLFGGFTLPERWRARGDARPFLLVLVGLTLWAASLLHLFAPLPEAITTTPAALLVAGGLYWSSRRQCTRCRGAE